MEPSEKDTIIAEIKEKLQLPLFILNFLSFDKIPQGYHVAKAQKDLKDAVEMLEKM